MKSPNHFLFTAVKAFVMRGSEIVARAKSSMMARRIAAALNYHAQRNEGRHD